jgi:hypothetical protein
VGYLLFFFYLVLLSWVLPKINFVKSAGLKPRLVIALFVLKVLAGIFSAWILRKDVNSDTWGYHRDALVEYHLLFNEPWAYFTNLFSTGYKNGYEGVLQFHNSYWNDLKTNLMVKFVSLLHIFSFGHYYVNVVLYNFLIFFGHIALFRVFSTVYKNKTRLLVITCFLLPSFLLFSSTLHKEGLVFAASSIACYCFFQLTSANIKSRRYFFILLFSFLIIFLFRSYVFIVMAPALLAWYIAQQTKRSPGFVFAIVFVSCIVLFFLTPYLLPSINLPQMVVQKQEDFFGLGKANSFINTDPLLPNLKSFVANMPQALNHALLRPFAGDFHISLFLTPFIVEMMFYQAMFLLFIFYSRKDQPGNPVIVFSIWFSLLLLLIIGYTVPVLWAIIRYRSIYLPFLLTPVFCSIEYKKIPLVKHIL